MPDVDDSPRDRFLGHDIHHPSVHEGYLALVRVLYDGVAILTEGGIGAPERAEDRGGGWDFVGLDGVGVGDFVDQSTGSLGRQSIPHIRIEGILTIPGQ